MSEYIPNMNSKELVDECERAMKKGYWDKKLFPELTKRLTELERLQKRDEDVRVKLIKRIELNKRLIKENYDIDTEVVSHLNVENTALEMVMMLMDWSDEE